MNVAKQRNSKALAACAGAAGRAQRDFHVVRVAAYAASAHVANLFRAGSFRRYNLLHATFTVGKERIVPVHDRDGVCHLAAKWRIDKFVDNAVQKNQLVGVNSTR